MIKIEEIKTRFNVLKPFLNEKMKRLFAGAEAKVIGYGGISEVSRAIGMSREAISLGLDELEEEIERFEKTCRIRKAGGGRKRTTDIDTTLKTDLENLMEPITRGDPESPLLWTCKSLRNLADELKAQKHHTSHRMVGELLHQMGFSLQANRKSIEGSSDPDRNEQFEKIYAKTKKFQGRNEPVISVDAKKKELVGNYKNNGKEWLPSGEPIQVNVYDFEDKQLGKAVPYGVYDITQNNAWVNVGINNDTSEFAVESIKKWWNKMGKETYPDAKRLYIISDGGGSNGHRRKLWKTELQRFANETDLSIHVSHLTPGTSKWNKIEHRLFSYISQNWRGKPLISYEVIVNLIASTTTKKGLKVMSELDEKYYQKGIKVEDDEMKALNIIYDKFKSHLNYIILPQSSELT